MKRQPSDHRYPGWVMNGFRNYLIHPGFLTMISKGAFSDSNQYLPFERRKRLYPMSYQTDKQKKHLFVFCYCFYSHQVILIEIGK